MMNAYDVMVETINETFSIIVQAFTELDARYIVMQRYKNIINVTKHEFKQVEVENTKNDERMVVFLAKVRYFYVFLDPKTGMMEMDYRGNWRIIT